LTQNDESKKHILAYRKNYTEANKKKQIEIEIIMNQQERYRRGRSDKDGSFSRYERDTSNGSRARNSLGRDQTPNRVKQSML